MLVELWTSLSSAHALALSEYTALHFCNPLIIMLTLDKVSYSHELHTSMFGSFTIE